MPISFALAIKPSGFRLDIKWAIVCGALALSLGSLPAQCQTKPYPPDRLSHFEEGSDIPGIFELDPGSGAASMYVPLGPGIGAADLRYIPALVGRFAPQVGMRSFTGLLGEVSSRPTLLATSGFELTPGFLELPLPRVYGKEGLANSLDIRWVYSDGSGSRVDENSSLSVNPGATLNLYGFGPAVRQGCLPRPASADCVPFLVPGTAGDFLIAM
jgi:hypothetical protein